MNVDDLIKELEEIKVKYGNIKSYNIKFYIEQARNEKILTI